jgi:hypothetical protein
MYRPHVFHDHESQDSRDGITISRFMSHSTPFRAHSAFGGSTVIALGCILSLAIAHVPASGAGAGGAALRPLDDSLPALPLTATFEKADGDNGPYALTLRNTSGNPIRASGSVFLNVGSNAGRKTRDIPEHVVDRAETWTIYGLSTGDRVAIEADSFAPLALTVP